MKLPDILAIEKPQADEAILTLAVPTTLDAFRGHFPDNPVLPGVVQIDWVVRFAAMQFGIPVPTAPDVQVKFRNIIRPDQPLALALNYNRGKNQLSFTYRSDDAVMSSGQLKLASA